MDLEIIRPGSPVTIAETIPGYVTSVMIGTCRAVKYEVSWWDGRNHKCEWFPEFQVEVRTRESASKLRIGFIE